MNKRMIFSKSLIGVVLLLSSGVCFGEFSLFNPEKLMEIDFGAIEQRCNTIYKNKFRDMATGFKGEIGVCYSHRREQLFQVLNGFIEVCSESLEGFRDRGVWERDIAMGYEDIGKGGKNFCDKEASCEVCSQIIALPTEYEHNSLAWYAHLIERTICYLGVLYNDPMGDFFNKNVDNGPSFEDYLKESGAQKVFANMKVHDYQTLAQSIGSLHGIMDGVHKLVSSDLNLQKEMSNYMKRFDRFWDYAARQVLYGKNLLALSERMSGDFYQIAPCAEVDAILAEIKQSCSPFGLRLNNSWTTTYEDFCSYLDKMQNYFSFIVEDAQASYDAFMSRTAH